MKLMLCGDLSVTAISEPAFRAVDASSAFGSIPTLLSGADRAIVNLECALTKSDHVIKKYGPNLKGPESTADTLRAAGFTDCALSNNHIFDFGIEGMRDTLSQLDRVGLGYTGFGNDYESSRKNMILCHDGLRVAIVNVCEHEYTYATDARMGARPFDEFETMHDIRQAKKDADFVVVIYHGGKELCRYPSPRLRKACREMVRCGADYVTCQHSHCIGCYEEFEGGHILYGQGNFDFPKDLENTSWNEGLIACLTLEGGAMTVDYVPVVSTETGVDLASPERREDILSRLASCSAQLTDGSWIEGWRAFCGTVEEQYRKAMAGYSSRRQGYTPTDSPDEYQRFAHYLDCEAHTDVWRELFKTWNHTNDCE